MLLLLRVVAIRYHSEQQGMMNILNKYLTITNLVISTLISGIYVDLAGAQNTSTDPAASRCLADIFSSPYLKFGRLTN